MSSKLFREGGPDQIKHLGGDQYRMSIALPTDEDGRLARECPDPPCAPGYFKVKPGTGITDGQSTARCPYCRRSADPNEFSTREQVRYAKDLVLREAQKGLDEVIKDALGLGLSGKRKIDGGLISIEMSYKPAGFSNNLGVMDRKYLERAQAALREGREIRVTASEVEDVLSAVNELIRGLYQGLVRIVEGDGV